jgi:hypothetical protein
MLILQLDPDVAPELIVLGEHCYHRDLENSSILMSIPVHKIVVRPTVLIWANIVKIL